MKAKAKPRTDIYMMFLVLLLVGSVAALAGYAEKRQTCVPDSQRNIRCIPIKPTPSPNASPKASQ